MINIITSSRYKVNRTSIKRGLDRYLIPYDFLETDVLNVIFVGKNKIRSIAQKYKKENEALPVLSFAYHDEKNPSRESERLIGEIFICYPQAVLLAAQRNKKVEDTIISLIEHGIENIICTI